MLLAWCPGAPASDFLGHHVAVDFGELERDLREAADASGGAAKIERSLWRTFAALPKNEFGRVSPQAVRYTVQRYFSKKYGWVIDGLGSQGSHFTSTDNEANIISERVPAYVEAMLEQKQSGHGLALNDVVILIIVLERLILDDNVESINTAFAVSGLSPSGPIDVGTLLWVHQAWVELNTVGYKNAAEKNYDTAGQDMVLFDRKLRSSKEEKIDMLFDAAFNYEFAHRHVTNPFVSHPYSPSASLDIAQEWSHQDIHLCNEMKAHLVELDPRGSGRVPLQVFYAQEGRSHGFYFGETAEYLRSIGALDESGAYPQVLIANYVASPGNCNRHTTYYSACCTSGCEDVMYEIEGSVLAPEGSPELIATIASKVSTSAVDAPRQIPDALVQKLHSIATLHGGVVPLHGRLFSQWLHFAFPSECPHLSTLDSSSMRTQWLDFEGSHDSVVIGDEDRAKHANASFVHNFDTEPSLLQWNDHEVLPFTQTHHRSAWRQLSQLTAVVAAVFASARVGVSAWCSLTGRGGPCSKEKWAHFV